MTPSRNNSRHAELDVGQGPSSTRCGSEERNPLDQATREIQDLNNSSSIPKERKRQQSPQQQQHQQELQLQQHREQNDNQQLSSEPSNRDNNTKRQKTNESVPEQLSQRNQGVEFILKRLAINNRVRNKQDHQPMIKFDFESNTILLSFNKSKVDVTKGRAEILIGMGDVQEMSYFEMNDAAVQKHNIKLDLDSFIYLHAEAERPGARSRTQEYNFELEFEEDEHFRDIIQAVEDSGLLTPIQTQPEDIEIDAKALIEDSRTKYKLRSQATTQTTQSINRDSTPTVMDTSSISTSNNMSQNPSINLFNLRKVPKNGSSKGRAKIVAAQAIKNSNGPKVSNKDFLDLQEENRLLKESENRAKEEVKRAQDILLQAGAIIVDEINDGDDHHKVGTKATTRSLLAVQELCSKYERLEDKVKNFEEEIDKAKKVLEQAWAIVI